MLIFSAVVATVLNIAILIAKFNRQLYSNALLDLGLLIAVFYVLKGSKDMLLIGVFSSLIISIYLWFCPPKLGEF